jgi:hypothetical protein
MVPDPKGSVGASSDGGVSGKHDAPQAFEFLVAPSTEDQFNTARLRLIPVACWRVDDIRFAFDSSFIAADPGDDPNEVPSDIRAELRHLVSLVQEHPGCPLSVFGHADPVGDDDYNKLLSGRRAMAIYALLIANSEISTAVKLWRSIASKENWGSKQHEMMQSLTGLPATTQESQLIQAYIQKLCPPDLKLAKTDFLARGADSSGIGDMQGCGEFNPLVLFSKEDQETFDQAARGDKKDPQNRAILAKRNAGNAANRRVLVLFFRQGSRIDPSKWPCPSVTDGTAKCKKRFWSDGETRRSTHLPGAGRSFFDTHDTFACRFFQRVSDRSPCEGLTRDFGLLHMQIYDGEGRVLLAKRKYEIRIVGQVTPRFKGVLNDQGILRHEFVPHDNYLLSVEGCSEQSPMIVLAMTNPVPTVRYLETSALTFFVTTTDGVPIDGAKVSIPDLGDKSTDLDGVADFGLVQAKQYKYSVSKDNFLAHHGDTAIENPDIVSLSNSANGVVSVAGRRAKPQASLNAKVAPPVVKSINAVIQGTKSTRTSSAKSLGPKTLPSSSSNANTPLDAVVLVRCDLEVELEAITDPPGQPVTWAVAANQSPGTPPAISPIAGGTKANLKLDQAGSFSASAAIGGSTILWNFVVVGLAVEVANVKPNLRDTFVDAAIFLKTHANPQGFHIPKDFFGVCVGEFAFGSHAWDSQLTVRYTGGGPKGDVGLAKVNPWYSQNITSSDVRGVYDGGAKGFNALANALKSMPKILDVGGPAGSGPGPVVGVTSLMTPQWPVTTAPGMVNVSPLDPATNSRVIKMGDSPSSGAFEKTIRNPSTLKTQDITHIDGFTKFMAAVVSWSEDAPNVVVLHATSEWLAYYQGHIAFPFVGDDHYVKDFAKMTEVTPWALVGAASGGMDAGNAGFEIFGPPLATTVSNQSQDNVF